PCADRGGGRTVAAIRQRSSVHFLHDSVGEVVAVNVAGPVLVQYGLDLLLGAGRLGEGGHYGMGENIGRHRLLGVQGTDRVGHPVAVLSDQLLDVVGGEGAGGVGEMVGAVSEPCGVDVAVGNLAVAVRDFQECAVVWGCGAAPECHGLLYATFVGVSATFGGHVLFLSVNPAWCGPVWPAGR